MIDMPKALLLCSILILPAAAIAQTPAAPAPAPAPAPATAAPAIAPAAIKVGKMLVSSDGHRLGRIDQVDKGSDGAPVTVELFSSDGIRYVPVATLSPANAGFATTMTYAAVMKSK